MRFLVLFSVLALLGAGCSRSDSGNEAGRTTGAAQAASTGSAPDPASAPAGKALAQRAASARWPSLPHRAGSGFARARDRGDLMAYPAQPEVFHEGAYTWHRADLSEAHALAAIVSGHLSLTAPSGEKLDFRYERHVEHASGDWTWVGRIDRGGASEEAIITFGERAAFGRIAQPGKWPLRLTIRDGKAWLVETDPAKVALINTPATRPTEPDYLLSGDPAVAARTASAAPSEDALAVDAVVAADGAPTVVDIVLGYTNGFAAGLGGASQAVTRLNFITEVANNGYINSQINARVRLVATVQVNYPDNTDNGDALEKLTGTRSVPVDPAFNGLRAAREQYGADLVSLVRKFSRPENNGCGIAWLNGSGQRGVSVSQAGNGYSVVSDGRVADGNTTYFCSDDTLAHEMGHNMGAQHDRDTASSSGTLQYGAYPYAFGYKQGGSAGFHTIMAYGDSGQRGYLVFSNPRISFCGGQLCGVADNADNARALSQSIPIVAQFRATVVPLPQPQPRTGWIMGLGGLCLDATGQGTGNGTSLQLWSCNGQANQQWSFANGIGAIIGAASGRAVDVIGQGTANGTRLQLWDAGGTANQAWSFRNMAIVANGGRVLDAVGVSSANQTRMQLWDGYGTPNQAWNFNPVTGELVGMDGKCLDVMGFGMAPGTPVQFWDCSGAANQKWRLEAFGQLVGFGGNCLEVADGRSDNGAPVRMWPCNGLPHQSWAFSGEIRSRASDRCLDDPGLGQANATRPHIWDCHGGANQRWTFYWK